MIVYFGIQRHLTSLVSIVLGTIHPEWCEAGFYCPEAQTKIPCPSGFYCPNATADKIPCPTGHYCPGNDNCTLSQAGAVNPTICPLGK